MKMKSFFLAGIFLAALSAQAAADAGAVLLKGKSVTVSDQMIVATEATVIFKDTQVQVSAAEITFDKQKGSMKCTGETTIRANGVTMKAQDATIEVGGRRIFTLSAGQITSEKDVDFGFGAKPVMKPELSLVFPGGPLPPGQRN